MAAEPLQHIRTFITESFTAVAVDIFSEVQNLVRSYEDENKRLRTLLNSVLQPQVQLSRIDATLALTESGGARITAVFSEADVEQLKEEQMECVISDDLMDQVKAEPDTVPISDSHSSADVNVSPGSSNTASTSASVTGDDSGEDGEEEAGNEEEEAGNEEEEAGNEEEEAGNEAEVTENGETSAAAAPEPPRQKTLLECPRFKKPDASFLPTPSEYKAFVSRLTDLYKDLPEEQRPLIALMGLDQDVEFVDCALGRVPKGCPLSYHHPLPSDADFTPLDDAPPQPRLPLQSRDVPPSRLPDLPPNEQDIVNGMAVTWEAAYTLEQSTRRDKDVGGELKNGRLFDCFRDVFSLKENVEGSGERLVSKIKRGKRRCKQATIEKELRTEALREYCRLVRVNWYPCGLVVHPGAPWVAARPDGLVYDPKEEISFGIVQVRCERLRSFTECKLVAFRDGALRVSAKDPCYWRVQGELMVTGTSWCDLLVFCADDMLVQRVYRDEAVISALKNKLDHFFFHNYLPSLYTCEED